MKRIPLIVIAVVSLARLSSVAHAGTGSFGEETRALFSLIDSAGYSEVSNGPFIEIAAGGYRMCGFLKSSNGSSFEATTLDLTTDGFNPSSSNDFKGKTASFIVLDFGEWMKQYMKSPPKLDNDGPWSNQPHLASSWQASLVLARACAARGLKEFSHQLYKRAGEFVSIDVGDSPEAIDRYFQDQVWKMIMGRALQNFANPKIDRKELLRQFQWLAINDPNQPKATGTQLVSSDPFISQAIKKLTSMIREDEAHHRTAFQRKHPLSLQEEVADLVFQLRDQTLDRTLEPYRYASIVPDPDSPAAKLVKIGYAAVPKLLDALKDTRFIRAERGMNADPPEERVVYRVRDAALRVLSQIAGGDFWTHVGSVLVAASLKEPMDLTGDIVWDGNYESDWQRSEARARWWWDDVVLRSKFSPIGSAF